MDLKTIDDIYQWIEITETHLEEIKCFLNVKKNFEDDSFSDGPSVYRIAEIAKDHACKFLKEDVEIILNKINEL